VSKGLGGTPTAFSTLNTKTVNQILGSKFYGANYSQNIWKNTDKLAKTLQEKLATAIATGQSPEKTIREFRDRFNVAKSDAARLIRTETNYFENRAALESYKALGIEQVQFIATLDSRTSSICRHHDHDIIEVDKAVQGDNVPPLHPYCRSTIAPYIGKEYEPEIRIARDPKTGRNKYVTNMSYNEWAKQEELGTVEVIDLAKYSLPSFMGTGKALSSQPKAVTDLDDLLSDIEPGVGSVSFEEGTSQKDITKKSSELATAEWIKSEYGGKIVILNERGSLRTPDFLRNSKQLIEVKYPKSETAIDTRLRDGIDQMLKGKNGYGHKYDRILILDLKDNVPKLTELRIRQIISNRLYNNSSIVELDRVIVRRSGKKNIMFRL
jgi:SPP1 gp7 family putative phage head morphogenesis protein